MAKTRLEAAVDMSKLTLGVSQEEALRLNDRVQVVKAPVLTPVPR